MLAMLLAGAVSAPVLAGTVYRCDSPDGARVYSSKKIQGSSCKAVSQSVIAPQRSVTTSRSSASVTEVPAAAGAVTTTASTKGSSSGAKAQGGRKARFLKMGSSTMYSYIDASGVRNYSNRRPKGVANVKVSQISYPIFEMDTCYACAVKPAVNFSSAKLNTTAYQTEIAAAARDFGVDEAIVRAIIHAESAYRPNALSRVGAQGLMQLMPATAKRFGVSNAFDAGQNIRGGVKYLSWLLKRFDGNLTLAAAGYNAGEGAVDKYKGVPPYNETRRYVERVGVLADRYRATLANQ